MKTLILYYSKYGTTKKCAELLAEKIDGGADVVGYFDRKIADIESYDAVIIGAPVYMGMLKKMKAYCENNLQMLLTKKLGLYICHLDNDTPMEEKIAGYFPKELLEHAAVTKGFGGAFDTGKMKAFDKFIYTKVAKTEGSEDKVDYSAVDMFAAAFAQ